MTSNWDKYIAKIQFSEGIYNKHALISIFEESKSTGILNIENILDKLVNDYFNIFSFKDLKNKSRHKGFFLLSSIEKWEYLMKKMQLSFSKYCKANQIYKCKNRLSDLTIETFQLDIIENVENLINYYYSNLKLLKSKDLLFNEKANLNIDEFWKIFLKNYKLEQESYDLSDLRTAIEKNLYGVINNVNEIIRLIMHCRMQYFSFSSKEELTLRECKTNPMVKILNKLSRESFLTRIEYDAYKFITDYFTKKQFLFESPEIKMQFLGSFNIIIQFLYNEAIEYTANIREIDNIDIQKPIEHTDSSTHSGEIIKNDAEIINELKAVTKIQENKMVDNMNESHETMDTMNQSKFLQKLKTLQNSSKESVVNANSFGAFQKYMHVERPIEKVVYDYLEQMNNSSEKQLLLICGSVGDGKSHLLAYIKEFYPHLLSNTIIHNDATESFDPNKSSLDTLEELLIGFEDNQVASQNIIIAINLGVLHNFYTRQKAKNKFQKLCQFIEAMGIFEKVSETQMKFEDNRFKLVNFAEQRNFELTKEGVTSHFFSSIIEKITNATEENSIYLAWKDDIESGIKTAAHENYQLLMNKHVQKRVVEMLIQCMLRDKIIVSTRAFYNFIFDIMVPTEQLLNPNKTGFAIENTLPNLLFNHPDRSAILGSFNHIDLVKKRSITSDEFVTQLLMSMDPIQYLNEHFSMFKTVPYEKLIKSNLQDEKEYNEKLLETCRFALRLKQLAFEEEKNSNIVQYCKYLYAYYTGDEATIGELFESLEQVIYRWKGTPQENYTYISNDIYKEFRIGIKLKLEPEIDESKFDSYHMEGTVVQFDDYIRIGFNGILFDLNLQLYEMLRKVKNGYRPNNIEMKNAIQFEEFFNQLIKNAEENDKSMLLVSTKTKAKFEISKPRFSKSKYEVKKVTR